MTACCCNTFLLDVEGALFIICSALVTPTPTRVNKVNSVDENGKGLDLPEGLEYYQPILYASMNQENLKIVG